MSEKKDFSASTRNENKVESRFAKYPLVNAVTNRLECRSLWLGLNRPGLA